MARTGFVTGTVLEALDTAPFQYAPTLTAPPI